MSAYTCARMRNPREPKDLRRRTIGMPEWAQNRRHYGGLWPKTWGDLAYNQMLQAGVDEAGRDEKVAYKCRPAP